MFQTLDSDEIAFSLTAPEYGVGFSMHDIIYFTLLAATVCGFLGCKHLQPNCEVGPSTAVRLCQFTPPQILLMRVYCALKNWVSHSNPEQAIYSFSPTDNLQARTVWATYSSAANPKQNTNILSLGKRNFWD